MHPDFALHGKNFQLWCYFNAFVKIIVCLVAAKIMEKKRIDSYGLFDSVSRKKKRKKKKKNPLQLKVTAILSGIQISFLP